jgi:hypothetical protein
MVAECEPDLIHIVNEGGHARRQGQGTPAGQMPKLNPRQEASLVALHRAGEHRRARRPVRRTLHRLPSHRARHPTPPARKLRPRRRHHHSSVSGNRQRKRVVDTRTVAERAPPRLAWALRRLRARDRKQRPPSGPQHRGRLSFAAAGNYRSRLEPAARSAGRSVTCRPWGGRACADHRSVVHVVTSLPWGHPWPPAFVPARA